MAGPFFDGSKYMAIDSGAFGDGETDDTTQPLNAGVENALDNNARYVRRQASRFGRTFKARAMREFASVDWAVFDVMRINIEPGLSTIKLLMLGKVAGDDGAKGSGSPAAGTIEVRLSLLGGGITGDAKEWAGDGTLQQYTYELDVASARTGSAYLLVEMRSEDVAQIDTTSSLSFRGGRFYEPSTEAFLDNDLDPTRYIEFHTQRYEILASVDHWPGLSSAPTGSKTPYVPAFNVDGPDVEILSTTAQLRGMSFLEPKSWCWVFDYDDDTPSVRWTPKGPFGMRPNEAIRGQDLGDHAANAAGLVQRDIIKSAGPAGIIEPQSTWPTDTAAKWDRVYGDDTSSPLESVGGMPIKLDHTDGTVTVRALVAAAHLVENVSSTDVEKLKDDGADAEWTFTFTVEQLATGQDWSAPTTVGTKEITLNMRHWLASPAAPLPLLRQMYWSLFGDYDNINFEYAEFDQYSTKEGQVWAADLGVVKPVAVEIPISGASREALARVNVGLSLGADPTYRAGETDDKKKARLALWWLGHVQLERGTLT